jgi:hypothetical protein
MLPPEQDRLYVLQLLVSLELPGQVPDLVPLLLQLLLLS